MSSSEVEPSRRKVTNAELLDLRERVWSPNLRGASLVAELNVKDEHTAQVAQALGVLYARAEGSRANRIFERWPACAALAVTGIAGRDYAHGTFWPAVWKATRYPGDQQDQTVWGRGFTTALAELGLPTFPDMPVPYVGPILMHTGIPTYCLEDFLRLLLQRRARDPDLDADAFLVWSTAHDRRVESLDVPVRRFLRHGSDYALDVIDRSLDLLGRLADPQPDLDGVGLPLRMVARARELVAEGRLDPRMPVAESRRDRGVRTERPRIGLDPFGRGVEVVLPAIGDSPDGSAVWHITADGLTATQRSQAQWVGVSEAAPQTTYAIPRPVRTVVVALAGSGLENELRVVDPESPMLVFGEDGRKIEAHASLPRDAVWVLHPDDGELVADEPIRVIVEGQLPLGWSGWRLRQVSLDGVPSIALAGHPATRRFVRGYTRPRIVVSEPVRGVTTPYGSPVFAQLPEVWLPGRADARTEWRIYLGPAGGDAELIAYTRLVGESTTVTDIWESVCRPVLGAFTITVRGPLGRGISRTVFVAEGLTVRYTPEVRRFSSGGLVRGRADVATAVGGRVRPVRLDFASADLGHVIEVQTETETEPLVVTPPHVQAVRERVGESVTWSAGPLRLTTESFHEEPGRLLVMEPGVDGVPAAGVVLGGREIQELTASGRPRGGVATFELGRIADTIAEHRHADLVLGPADGQMPLAFIRPRRLATGVQHLGDHLLLHDVVDVPGLNARIYAVRAPWREPTIVAVEGGTVSLPPALRHAGPLLVRLQVESGWTFTEWPRWPTQPHIATTEGCVHSDDDEETALSRFLAGMGDLPYPVRALGRLWCIVDLAPELRPRTQVPQLLADCSDTLRKESRRALLALPDAGLGVDRSIAALVATGLAASPVPDGTDAGQVQRMWSLLPAAAALLTGDLVADDECHLALQEQCGETMSDILAGGRDQHAGVGRFGPEVEPLALMSPGQLSGVWNAANVVPRTLLDPDTRMTAARQLFDGRAELGATPIARGSPVIVKNVLELVGRSGYPDLAAQITARMPPAGNGGWRALPAVSAALAVLARLAGHGDAACRAYEQTLRPGWTVLAGRAPHLVTIDLVLAELLLLARRTE